MNWSKRLTQFRSAFVETPDHAVCADRIGRPDHRALDCFGLVRANVVRSQNLKAMQTFQYIQHSGVGGNQVNVLTRSVGAEDPRCA
jgi:hypothetical protein